eukprot:scaffold38757_cov20-Prasinocladus_malaysianus.AAC.1
MGEHVRSLLRELVRTGVLAESSSGLQHPGDHRPLITSLVHGIGNGTILSLSLSLCVLVMPAFFCTEH